MFAAVRYLLDDMPYAQAALVFLLQNVAVFVGALVLGRLLMRGPRVSPDPPPIERLEIVLAVSTVVLNAAITWAGLWLYRQGIITIASDIEPLAVARDVAVLVLGMDFAMYVLHRVAHIRWLYPWLHGPHHRYTAPRPLTLFALHPAETLSFGGLWLMVLWLYPTSWLAITIYLTLNLIFGVVGHLGVEPIPGWPRHRIASGVAGSTFHARHHMDPHCNYGFYTTLWDRLFRTYSV